SPGRGPALVATRSWSANTAKTRFCHPTSRRSSARSAATPPARRQRPQTNHAMRDEAPNEVAFIITIDTEGDDLGSSPREITTRNAKYLPRFQALCTRFKFRPVYLTDYEMA